MIHVHVYKVESQMAEFDLDTDDTEKAKAEALYLTQSCRLELKKSDCRYIALIPTASIPEV